MDFLICIKFLGIGICFTGEHLCARYFMDQSNLTRLNPRSTATRRPGTGLECVHTDGNSEIIIIGRSIVMDDIRVKP